VKLSKILVTGGAGFIGSHTIEFLLEQGYSVIALDDLRSGDLSNIEHVLGKIKFVRGDIRDRELLERIMRDVDGVIHLAAIVSVDEATEFPELAFDVNAVGTLNLLECARKHDVERFVYASSAAVYGDPSEIPVKETTPTKPMNPYGASKLAGEALVTAYATTYELSTISLRYFNVYGPRMRTGPYAGVILKFITAALKGEPLCIFGDGTQTRDFVYVRDVARANVLALESKEKGVFNVGTGKETRIIDLAKIISKLIGRECKIVFSNPRPGDIYRSVADITNITKRIGWQPKISLLEGLKITIKHI